MLSKIYIIIVNYNTWQDCIECIESLKESSFKNFQVLLVDNHSQNDSYEQLDKYLIESQNNSFTKLIRAEKNGGFAAGNNIALAKIISEDAFVCLLNPDTLAEKSMLYFFYEYYQKQTQEAIIGGLIKSYYKPTEIITWGGGIVNNKTGMATLCKTPEQITDINYIHGGMLFTHLSVFRKVGLLPEEYFLYWEETDWCKQAQEKRITLEVCKDAICYDKVGGSIGRGYLAEYYYTLNSLRFHKKHFPKNIKGILRYNRLRLLKKFLTGKLNRYKAIRIAIRDFKKI